MVTIEIINSSTLNNKIVLHKKYDVYSFLVHLEDIATTYQGTIDFYVVIQEFNKENFEYSGTFDFNTQKVDEFISDIEETFSTQYPQYKTECEYLIERLEDAFFESEQAYLKQQQEKQIETVQTDSIEQTKPNDTLETTDKQIEDNQQNHQKTTNVVFDDWLVPKTEQEKQDTITQDNKEIVEQVENEPLDQKTTNVVFSDDNKSTQEIDNKDVTVHKKETINNNDEVIIERANHYKPQKSMSGWKYFLIQFTAITLAGVTLFGAIKYLAPLLPDINVTNTSSDNQFNQLLKEGQYFEVAEKYPERINEIERVIYQSRDTNLLKEFVEKYPTKNGQFDLAFSTNDFSTVINIGNFTQTEERQMMLALSYAKIGQFEDALIIQEKINSSELYDVIKNMIKNKIVSLIKENKIKEATELNKQYQTDLDVLIKTSERLLNLIQQYKIKMDNGVTDEEIISAGKNYIIYEKELNELLR